jgi:hypothetical protein
MALMAEGHEEQQEDLTARLQGDHDAAIKKVKTELANEHDG